MKKLLLLCFGVVGPLAACAAPADESTAASEARVTEEPPLLDCAKLGGFPEEAMKALAGTYERAGTAPSNSLLSFTVGPLQDVPGWGGKTASYTRDMAAPCMDFVAMGDGSTLTASSTLPMTSTGCAGQSGKMTTIFDNPALGAVITFEDASGLPFGKDFYFVTSSRLEADGRLSAICLSNGGTGESILMVQKR